MTNGSERYRSIKFFLPLLLLPAAFLCSRFHNIYSLPIFNDEAFYVHWSAIIHDDPSQLWISKIDGKTPLFFWVNAITYGFFDDPLLSGRIVSVFSGCTTVVLLYLCGVALKRPRAGIAASLFYIAMPLAIFNDTLATVDAFHTSLVIAMLYATIVATQAERFTIKLAVILGVTMSAAFYAKTPTLLFAPLSALTILVMRKDRWDRKLLINLGVVYAIFAAAVAFYLTRDVEMIGGGGSPIFHRSRFFIPWNRLKYLPFGDWMRNINDLGDYLWNYFGLVPLIAAIPLLVIIIYNKRTKESVLSLWSFFPVIVVLLITKETFSRYYLVLLTPIFLVIGLGFDPLLKWASELKTPRIIEIWIAIGLMLIIQYGAFTISKIGFAANLIPRDTWQYVEGYPSGFGVNRVVEYLKNEAVSKKITVFTTMSWGVPDDAVWLYLRKTSNARVIECFWWDRMPILSDAMPQIPLLTDKFTRKPAGTIPTSELGEAFFVTRSNPFPQPEFEAANRGSILVLEAKKPGGKESFLVYKLAPVITIR